MPGVSGGTIAFITGIYERLLVAIKVGSSPLAWTLLFRGKVSVFWKAVDGTFMSLLLLGILAAIFSVSSLMHHLLVEQTTALLSFFTGLTVAAAAWIALEIRLIRPALIVATAAGLALTFSLSLAPVTELSETPPLQGYFAAGMIAFCAMILPGISGSLILLLLGVYPFLIEALHLRDMLVLAVFAAGGVVGLAVFVRLIRWALVHHHDVMVAALIGMMLGALPKLWPWKQPGEGIKVILQPSIWPNEAAEPQYLVALLALLGGALLFSACEAVAKRLAAR